MLDETIAAFKINATKHIPRISVLNLDRSEWSALIEHHTTKQVSRPSRFSILLALSDTLKIEYEALILQLGKEQPSREAKPFFNAPQIPRKRKITNHDSESSLPNSMIMERTDNSILFQSPIAKRVRLAKLEPATPEQGYSNVKRTPGKTKVHAIYSNGIGGLFKPLTPYNAQGMVNIEKASHKVIKFKLPKLVFDRPKCINFTATLPKMTERQNKSRRVAQNRLMQASCREVFAAHGTETVIKIHGSNYHWSHLIAHFLGGSQSQENLIPGTAASNYNTLELVEQFIARKLTDDKIVSIDISVNPTYSGESLIPDELLFQLKWMDAGRPYVENIAINPRSSQRITKSMHGTVELLRELAQTSDEELRLSSTPSMH